MDHVIEQQALDCWDSFPLFQLLNDYLRNHRKILEFFIFENKNLLLLF
jgi:hypothetical protein